MELRIGHLTTSYHTCFILMGTKWVEEIGLKCKWSLFPTGPEMVRAFEVDKVDIGYIGLPPTIMGIDRGLKIKCIAGGHVEGTVLTAKKCFRSFSELGNAGRVLAQFKGKRIGTPSKGSIHDVIIRTMIKEAGLERDMEVKNFKWADLIIEAMVDGEVEGGCGTPSLAVIASQLLDCKVVLPPHAMWSYNPSYGIVTKKELIEKHTDLLKDFLWLHEKACNFIRNQPEKAAEITSMAISLPEIVDENFVLQTYKISPKYCASLPKRYIDSTLAFIPTLQKMGYISKNLTEKDIFYTKLINEVHNEKPHYDDPDRLGYIDF